MATPIYCDVHDQAHLADLLVTPLDGSQGIASCRPGYLELCRGVVEQAEAAEREATDAEATARLEGSDHAHPGRGSPESSGEGAAPAGPRSKRGAAQDATAELSDATAADQAAP